MRMLATLLVCALNVGIVDAQSKDVCADVVQNGVVDIEDLLKVLSDFGKSGSGNAGDVVQDSANKVDIEDLIAILSAYGQKTKCRAKPKTMYYATLIKGKSPTSPNLQLVGNAKIDKIGLHLDGEGDMARVKHMDYAKDASYSLSFWFQKTKCHRFYWEYMYSHQRKNPTTGANDITGKNQNANINIYMGCEKSVGKWGGVNTQGKKIKQNGSFMRTIIKDDSSTVGLIDLPLHQAGDFDAITHEWVHVVQTVTPNSLSYHLDGKFMEDSAYAVFMHTGYAKSSASTFWPKPSKLQKAFKQFTLSTKTHLGGRADSDKDRHFPGSMAYLNIWDKPIAKNLVKALFSSEENLLPDCKGVYGGKNYRDGCGTCDANSKNDKKAGKCGSSAADKLKSCCKNGVKSGKCVVGKGMCSRMYKPVCGCDGKTYSNTNCAGLTVKSSKNGGC